MTENDIYGVWLQQALGEGSRKVPSLLEYFGSCKAVYEADEQELRLSGMLLPKEVTSLSDTSLDAAAEILEACRRLGHYIITPDDEIYPNRLRNIPDYPAALYICGEFPDIDDELCIAIVGTRRASRYGYSVAMSISKDLAACGAIIISGCARGIDTAAHQGALLAGGKTIAVLGCGINERYNMENEGLRKVIASSGALISEYPPGSPALSYHFPIRNRIISALSLGVVVVEAGAKSGSLITANIALDQGKDIYSVPGQINHYMSKGTNRLIIDGAKPIENAGDVLEDYVSKFPHRIRSVNLMDENSRVFEKHVRPKWDREAISEMSEEQRAGLPLKTAEKIRQAEPPKTVRTPRVAPKNETADSRSENSAKEPICPAPVGMSQNAEKVRRLLTDQPKRFDLLLTESGLDSSELSRSITELELYAAVKVHPGSKYSKG